MNQESMNLSSGKLERSMFWIVGTIWANIIIVFLIVAVFMGFFFMLAPQIPIYVIVGQLLYLLLPWGVIIFATRLGVKSVLAKSIVKKEKILKISILTGLIAFLLPTIFYSILFLGFYLTAGDGTGFRGGLWQCLLLAYVFVVIPMIYAGVTYFWCKRLVK